MDQLPSNPSLVYRRLGQFASDIAVMRQAFSAAHAQVKNMCDNDQALRQARIAVGDEENGRFEVRLADLTMLVEFRAEMSDACAARGRVICSESAGIGQPRRVLDCTDVTPNCRTDVPYAAGAYALLTDMLTDFVVEAFERGLRGRGAESLTAGTLKVH